CAGRHPVRDGRSAAAPPGGRGAAQASPGRGGVQKFLNDPNAFVDEVLDGILVAHGDQLRRPATRAIVRTDAPVHGKVAIATGGGSGHLPVFLGYVGRGLADGVAVGNVFASPSSEAMLDVTRAISSGAGVL